MTLQDKLRLTVLIVLITSSEALGQFLLRTYHNAQGGGKRTYLQFIPTRLLPFCTWGLYGLCTFMLLHSYNYTTMGKAEVYWDALSALVVPLIGVIVFKNTITAVGWFGITLIAIGTLLLGFDRDSKLQLWPWVRFYHTI